MVLVAEMLMITAPVGVSVYAISEVATDVPMQDVFRGIFPFPGVMVIIIIILLVFPLMAPFLPGIMN
ncbi:TRAP transporter large permease subunit [Chloroflexota bacterium]